MKKTLVVLVCMASICLVSCGKSPFFSKDGGKAFSIIDARIGTGAKTLDTYKNKFNKTEKIFLAYDLKNITGIVEDKDTFYWIRQDLSIKDRKGNIVLLKQNIVNVKDKISAKPLRFVNEVDLSGVNIEPGTYYAVIFVTDMASFKSSWETLELEIVK